MLLNANASDGSIRVQFKDALGNRVLAGYGLDDCTPVTSDGQATPVTWQGKAALPTDVVRIEFELTRASLFGFRISQD